MAKRSCEDSPSAPLGDTPSESISSAGLSIDPSSRRKFPHTDSTPEERVMKCSLPPHKGQLSFGTYQEYETHYIQAHVHRCSMCRKNFPSDLYLIRHIEENHDPILEEKKARGEKTSKLPMHRRRLSLTTGKASRDGPSSSTTTESRNRHDAILQPLQTFSTQQSAGEISKNDISTEASLADTVRCLNKLEIDGSLNSTRNHAIDSQGEEEELAGLTKSMSALRFVPPSVTRLEKKKAG
ncbi:hypothetical protein FQN57_005395 [Myotisia sp. PD_48]|nr:hypothetical protein FQN57_005395 [Myotisia sp. PD_48]